MNNQTSLKTGISGSMIAAICCATPVLVIALGVVGLSAWAGWLDYVLIPTFVMFVGITIYGLHRRRAEAVCCEVATGLNHKEGNLK